MNQHLTEIRPGTRIWFDDERHEVLAIDGVRLHLRGEDGRHWVALTAYILGGDDFSIVQHGRPSVAVAEGPGRAGDTSGRDLGAVLENDIPPDELARAQLLMTAFDAIDDRRPYPPNLIVGLLDSVGHRGRIEDEGDTSADRNGHRKQSYGLHTRVLGPQPEGRDRRPADLTARARRQAAPPDPGNGSEDEDGGAELGTVTHRLEDLARRLGYDRSSIMRLWSLRHGGLWALVDKRKVKPIDPLRNAPPLVREAILAQLAVETEESYGDMKRLMRRVYRRLGQMVEEADHAVKVPSRPTLRRYVAAAVKFRYATASAKTLRENRTRPPANTTRMSVTIPGQVVEMDATWLDVLAYDPVEDVTYSVVLTTAIDVATRTLLAWRLTPNKSKKAVDVSSLVADCFTPLNWRPDWPESVTYQHLRLPARLVSLDERLAAAACKPVIYPAAFLVDNEKVFVSVAIRDVCERLGIDLQPAALGTPTHKGHVERLNRTIASRFSQHVAGYKGNTVPNRGRHVENVACFDIDELNDLFSEWVVVDYQRTEHSSLFLPDTTTRVSPNEMYAFLTAVHGAVAVPADPQMFFELYPLIKRQISHDGISYGALTYGKPGDPAMDFAGERSHYRDGKHPFRVDPRDLRSIFWPDPRANGAYTRVYWKHAPDHLDPMSDRSRELAKAAIRGRGERPDSKSIAAEVEALQNKMDDPGSTSTKSRRHRAAEAARGRAAARDRARAGIPDLSTPLTTEQTSQPVHPDHFAGLDPASIPTLRTTIDLDLHDSTSDAQDAWGQERGTLQIPADHPGAQLPSANDTAAGTKSMGTAHAPDHPDDQNGDDDLGYEEGSW